MFDWITMFDQPISAKAKTWRRGVQLTDGTHRHGR
jgi:hypothetical protein